MSSKPSPCHPWVVIISLLSRHLVRRRRRSPMSRHRHLPPPPSQVRQGEPCGNRRQTSGTQSPLNIAPRLPRILQRRNSESPRPRPESLRAPSLGCESTLL
uniref:Uncharacterized protein n=1 Tax=Trypanosoma congolense (strain IL3000) TaxID=1068625 RepID=G0UQE0_TRYCI|nr:hypothetical protein, unlikely [Trypanosoma congolense IL3000]